MGQSRPNVGATTSAGKSNRTADAPPTVKEIEREEKMADEEFGAGFEGNDANSIFSDYVPARLKGYTFLKEHPDPVTETSTLNLILPPKITYSLCLPLKSMLDGHLTSLQLESIYYACQQHDKILAPCESNEQAVRAGFFMGDGPGMGKGRQIAGLILENHLRGRSKHIWISVSGDLADDAKRDLKDIGAQSAIKVHDLRNYTTATQLSKVKELDSGILFCTYTLLVQGRKEKGKGKSRLEQIVEWCGPGFDGVLTFDEAHKAKNLKFSKTKKTRAEEDDSDDDPFANDNDNNGIEVEVKQKGTKAAVCAILLQERLPSARVVYVSATGASEPEHLLYASRLGLWGPNTPFENRERFVQEITDGGTGCMELLSMHMKREGQYLARSLSFKGASFHVEEVQLSPAMLATYNASVQLWNDLWVEIKEGLTGIRSTQFWASSLRFWKQLCMSTKVDAVVRLARRALAESRCVVIGLQDTGEATAAQDEGGCSNAEAIVCHYLKHWSGLGKAKQGKYLARTKQLSLPMNPLDRLVEDLGGVSMVAEMTGRSVQQVWDKRAGVWKLQRRAKDPSSADAINIQERKRFMSGTKKVAIISDAASTGISLQADRRVKNQDRRVHITLQLPWSADKAVQQMGRSHRSNQTSAPEFILLMTSLGGEWRFASAVANRLQQLGAITQGDRRATAGTGIQGFAVDKKYGAKALRHMYDAVRGKVPTEQLPLFLGQYAKDPSVAFSKFAKKAEAAMYRAGLIVDAKPGCKEWTPSLNQFMNRLLGVEVKLQKEIFEYWQFLIAELIADARRLGLYSDSIVTISAGHKNTVVENELLLSKNGAETRFVRVATDRGVTWEQALQLCQQQQEEERRAAAERAAAAGAWGAQQHEQLVGFYRNIKYHDARYNMLLALKKPGQVASSGTPVFVALRPYDGNTVQDIPHDKLLRDFQKVSPGDMEKQWTRLYEHAAQHCGHSSKSASCVGPSCDHKKRHKHVSLLTGSVLPFWKEIQATQPGKTVKVYRVETSDGSRFVGAGIPESSAHEIKNAIGGLSGRAGSGHLNSKTKQTQSGPVKPDPEGKTRKPRGKSLRLDSEASNAGPAAVESKVEAAASGAVIAARVKALPGQAAAELQASGLWEDAGAVEWPGEDWGGLDGNEELELSDEDDAPIAGKQPAPTRARRKSECVRTLQVRRSVRVAEASGSLREAGCHGDEDEDDENHDDEPRSWSKEKNAAASAAWNQQIKMPAAYSTPAPCNSSVYTTSPFYQSAMPDYVWGQRKGPYPAAYDLGASPASSRLVPVKVEAISGPGSAASDTSTPGKDASLSALCLRDSSRPLKTESLETPAHGSKRELEQSTPRPADVKKSLRLAFGSCGKRGRSDPNSDIEEHLPKAKKVFYPAT